MKLISITFSNIYTLTISVNWIFLLVILIISYVISILCRKSPKVRNISVDEVNLGIGPGTITLKYDQHDREVAYMMWVELNTRKIGLELDEKNDVISEVYDSWYSCFGIIRNLLKEIPSNHIDESSELIRITTDVINCGLRPHLTKWQAKYRKWLDENKDKYTGEDPQTIQQKYPMYNELISDLKKTNCKLIKYKELLHEIAFKNA